MTSTAPFLADAAHALAQASSSAPAQPRVTSSRFGPLVAAKLAGRSGATRQSPDSGALGDSYDASGTGRTGSTRDLVDKQREPNSRRTRMDVVPVACPERIDSWSARRWECC